MSSACLWQCLVLFQVRGKNLCKLNLLPALRAPLPRRFRAQPPKEVEHILKSALSLDNTQRIVGLSQDLKNP